MNPLVSSAFHLVLVVPGVWLQPETSSRELRREDFRKAPIFRIDPKRLTKLEVHIKMGNCCKHVQFRIDFLDMEQQHTITIILKYP